MLSVAALAHAVETWIAQADGTALANLLAAAITIAAGTAHNQRSFC